MVGGVDDIEDIGSDGWNGQISWVGENDGIDVVEYINEIVEIGGTIVVVDVSVYCFEVAIMMNFRNRTIRCC